ncbi:MAG: hypothetical protein AAF573_03275 [Bacteroidota bacterium]
MQSILCLLDARASKAFQRSRKEKEQVENLNLLLNRSLPSFLQNRYNRNGCLGRK